MSEKPLTKKAKEELRRAEMGRCTELVEEDRGCKNWAIDRVNGRAYCGVHLGSIIQRADREGREAARKAEVEGRIASSLAWHELHPSVWDPKPVGWEPPA